MEEGNYNTKERFDERLVGLLIKINNFIVYPWIYGFCFFSPPGLKRIEAKKVLRGKTQPADS